MPSIELSIGVVGAEEAKSQLQGVSAAISDTGTKAATAGSKFGSFGAALKSQAGSITAVVGSGVLLFNMFDSLADAQNRVNAANVGLERANLRVAKAHDTLTQAIAKYGPNSAQAAQASQAYSIALGRQEIAQELVKNTGQDMGRAMANVAQNVIPGIITAVASMTQAMSALGGGKITGALSTLKAAFSSLISGGGAGAGISALTGALANIGANATSAIGPVNNMGGALRQFGTNAGGAVSGISAIGTAITGVITRHPILIAATVALAAAFILLRTNAFGVTDRLNELGASIGKAAPALVPFLNALKAGGEAVGIFGSKTQEAGKAVAGSAQGVNTMSEAIRQMGKEQAAAKAEASALFSQLAADALKGTVAMKGLDFSSITQKLPEGARASEGAVKLVNEAIQAFNTNLEKTHSPQAAVEAGQAAINQRLVGTVEASDAADGAMSRMISTAKWLATGQVVVGQGGVLGTLERLKELHIAPTMDTSNVTAGVNTTTTELKKIENTKTTVPSPNTSVFESGIRQMTQGTVLQEGLDRLGALVKNFKWPSLPELKTSALGTMLNGSVLQEGLNKLADIIKNFKWPALPQLPKPDTSVFESGLNTLKTNVTNIIDEIGIAFDKLKPVELTSRFGDISRIRIGFVADASQATPTIEKLKTDVNTVPRDWLTLFLANPLGLITGATTAKQATIQVPDNKTTTFQANTSQALALVNPYAVTVKTTVPDNKNTTFQANTAQALALVNPYAITVKTSIPDNKRTTFDALTSPAESKVNPYKVLLDKVAPPSPLTTTINANIQQAEQQLRALLSLEARAGIGGTVNVNIKLAEGGVALLSAKLTSKIQAAASAAGAVGVKGAGQAGSTAPIYSSSVRTNVAPVYSSGALRTNVAPPANVGGISGANAPMGIPVNPQNPYQAPAPQLISPYISPTQKAATGGSFIVDQPTQFGNITVGEGYKPELLTLIPLGSSGAAILNVIPLKGNYAQKQTGMQGGGHAITMDNWFSSGWGTGGLEHGNSGSETGRLTERINRLLSLIEKLISAQAKGLQANLMVDGQRMASVTSRYLASRAYGDQ